MFGTVTAYACPADKAFCYSVESPTTNALFKQLQTQINRFAPYASFTPLAVDGLLGEKSAEAARKAIDYAIGKLPDGPLKANLYTWRPLAASRQLLAPISDALGPTLAQAATALNLSTGAPIAPPPPTAPVTPQAITTYIPPATAGFWSQRTMTEKAIMGVGAVSVLGTVLLLLWPKKRKRT